MRGTFVRFDARPGGSYRMVLTYADASADLGKTTADSDVVEARFIDIVPGVRLVQAVTFVADDSDLAGGSRILASFVRPSTWGSESAISSSG